MPFKSGAFRTAIDAQVAIVPVCFNSYAKAANYNKLKSGTIVCQVFDLIETKGLNKADAGELAKKCHQLMNQTIEKLDQEYPAV
jgi:1-acyl-sn-glycerol-3-phosphate acyltransferase